MWLSLFVALATPPVEACDGEKSCTDTTCTMANPGAEADAAEVEAAKAEPTATTVNLSLSGMKCGACSAKVTTALEGVEGVTAAAVDHTEGSAEVVLSPGSTTPEALIAVLTELGYEAKVVSE